MESARLLIVAMAEQCRCLIANWQSPDPALPKPLQPRHLLWMCRQIELHAEQGPLVRLHRWIGFIQAAMLAHRMLDLAGLQAMFDRAKVAHGELSEDLLDHLDPNSDFELELGGEG